MWIATTTGSGSVEICGTATGPLGPDTSKLNAPLIGSSRLEGVDHATDQVPAKRVGGMVTARVCVSPDTL